MNTTYTAKNLLIFSIGVLTSLFAIFLMHYNHIAFDYMGDSGGYIHPALGLFYLGKLGWFEKGEYVQQVMRLPVYPWFIFIAYKFFGPNNNLAVVIAQAFIMGGITLLTSKTAKIINSKYEWFAVILIGLCPNLFFRASLILPDLLFTFLILCGIYFFIFSLSKNFLKNLILSSIFFGLAFLTRPALILYPLFTFPFLILLIKNKKKLTTHKAFLYAFLHISLMATIIAPQIVYEKIYTGEFMLTTQGGDHALFWVYPCLKHSWGGKLNIETLNNVRKIYNDRVSKLPKEQQSNLALLANIQKKLFIEKIAEMPKLQLLKGIIGSSLKMLFYTSMLGISEGFHHYIPHISLYNPKLDISELTSNFGQFFIFVSEIILFLLRGIQLIGFFYGIYNKHYRAITLYLFMGMLSFVTVSVGIGNPRFRAPIEPILIIFTVFGVLAIKKVRLFGWSYQDKLVFNK